MHARSWPLSLPSQTLSGTEIVFLSNSFPQLACKSCNKENGFCLPFFKQAQNECHAKAMAYVYGVANIVPVFCKLLFQPSGFCISPEGNCGTTTLQPRPSSSSLSQGIQFFVRVAVCSVDYEDFLHANPFV